MDSRKSENCHVQLYSHCTKRETETQKGTGPGRRAQFCQVLQKQHSLVSMAKFMPPSPYRILGQKKNNIIQKLTTFILTIVNTFRVSKNVHVSNMRKLKIGECKCVQGHPAKLPSELGFELGLCPWGGGGGEEREVTCKGHFPEARPWAGHPTQQVTFNYRTLAEGKCNPFFLLIAHVIELGPERCP